MSMDALAGFSSIFLASASAISAGGVAIHLRNQFGDIYAAGDLDCVDANNDGNCSLGQSYGNGFLAINILSVIFNGILLINMLYRWATVDRKNVTNLRSLKAVFSVVALSILLAVSTAGFNLYEQQNFGRDLGEDRFGDGCTAAGGVDNCVNLTGTRGDAMLGLNATVIALSGFVLLFYTGVLTNRMLAPERRILKNLRF